MQYFMPDGVYDVLKWVGLIALTLNALGVLIGTLIGASQLTATEV